MTGTTYGDPQTDGQGVWFSAEDEKTIELLLHEDRIKTEVRRRRGQERAGPVPPFDSGLLGEVLARPERPWFRVHELVPAEPAPTSPNAPRGTRMRLPRAPAHTGLSLRTLRRLIERGELRAYRVAGTRALMVDSDDLDELMIPVNGGPR